MKARVLVMGAHRRLRELLVDALAASPAVASCRGADLEEVPASASTDEPIDWLVWVAAQHADGDQAEIGARPWLDSLAQRSEARLLLVASSAVYPPSAHHPGHVDEQYRPAARLDNPVAASWRQLEDRARAAVGAERLAVLRASPVAMAGGDDRLGRLLSGALAPVPVGFDPSLQLLAPRDLATAVCRVVENGRPGVWNVAPTAVVPLRRALRLVGCRRLPLPAWLWPRKAAGRLAYLRYAGTVSGRRIAEELGFEPRWSSAAALRGLSQNAAAARSPEPPTAAEAAPEAAEEFDPFGMDRGYIDRLGRTLFRFLHDAWWRIEYRGLEHLPTKGAGVLVGVHRGHQPWDAVMLLHKLVRRMGRYPRFLIHPTLVKFPFLAPYILKLGGIHASHENADWALARGHLVGVFPEGIRGAFSMYRDAYTLRRFGRHEYVRMALRHQVPIVPFVTIGSAEIFPIFGRIDWAWFRRFTEWPFLPITPTMGTVPLPSKWHTRFLEPIHVAAEHGPEAAEDPAVVRALGREIKQRMAKVLTEMRSQRRSIFFGRLQRWEAAE